jgi:hypothetical protein
VNVTSIYAETGLLICPDPSEDVTVSLINWGSYRPLAVLDSLHSSVELGEGIYLLTWGWPVNAMEASVIPGATTVIDLLSTEIPEHHVMNIRGEE